jgi:hypothetical protein
MIENATVDKHINTIPRIAGVWRFQNVLAT